LRPVRHDAKPRRCFARALRLATFPTDAPTRQLDHALLRGRLGPVRDQSSRQLPLSDHRALIVDL
jgi:endonuclease/exonuclease/phosphatase (EEP) superfamily protein YafD